MKKWFSALLAVSILFSLLTPAGVQAAVVTPITDALTQSTENTIVKKNAYTEDLADVCYFSGDSAFFAAGKGGRLLKSTDGTQWDQVTDADIASSTSVDFVALDCSSNIVALIGNDLTTTPLTNYVYIKSGTGQFTKTNLSTIAGANGSGITVNDVKINGTNIFIVTDNGYVYRSLDSGATWTHFAINSSGNYRGSKSITTKGTQFMAYNNNRGTESMQYYYLTTTPATNAWTQGNHSVVFPGTITDSFFGADNKWYHLSNNGTTGYMTSFIDGGNPASQTADYIPMGGFSVERSVGQQITIIVGYKDDTMIIRSTADNYHSSPGVGLHKITDNSFRYAHAGAGKLNAVTGANISSTWTYIAVGDEGTILRSTNGYHFTPVAQVADTTATITHFATYNGTVPSFKNSQVAISSDNKVYFSENGTDFIEWTNVNIRGEVVALEFPNNNNADVFVGTVDHATNTSYTYKLSYDTSTETAHTDFIATGFSRTPSGIALLGHNSANQGKIVTNVTATFDGTNNRGTLAPIHMVEKIGNDYFAVSGTALHFVEWNNREFRDTYNVFPYNARGLGHSYKKYAQSGQEHLLMDETGNVRLLASVTFSQAQIREEVIYNGPSVGLTNFELKDLISVNDVYFTSSKQGKLSYSFDGIVWEQVVSFANKTVADITKVDNNLIVVLQDSTVHTIAIPHSPKAEESYTQFPYLTLNKPSETATYYTNVPTNLTFTTSTDPGFNDGRRTFQWYTENQGTLTEITSATGYSFDIGSLPVGTHNIVGKAIHTDATKVDRPTVERLYGPFTYTLIEGNFDVSPSYSSTSFEAIVGYAEADVQPITLDITNTGNIRLDDIVINPSNNYITASSYSADLNPTYSKTINLKLDTGLGIGTYTTDVTVSSLSHKFAAKTETITINVLAPPVYTVDVVASGTNQTLPYNYSSAAAKGTLSLTNTGNRNITDLQFILSDTTNFQLGTLPGSIAIGANANVDITPINMLTPGNQYSYTVEVILNGTTVNSYTFNIDVQPIPNHAFELNVAKTAIVLEEGYGATEGHNNVEITSIGNSPINDISASLSGADAASFTLDPNPINNELLHPGSISFSIKPVTGLTTGTYQGTITVTSATYSLSETKDFSLYILDEPANYSFTGQLDSSSSSDPTTLTLPYNYSSINQNTFEYTVTNNGNAPTNPVFTSMHSNQFTISSAPSMLLSGQSSNLVLRVPDGLTEGSYQVQLKMDYESSTEYFDFTIVVEETPVYSLSHSATTPTSVTVGYGSNIGKFSLEVENDGNRDVTGINIVLSDATNFTMASYPTSLAVRSSFSTEIYLNTGLAVGSYELTLTVTADNGISFTETKTIEVLAASTPTPTPTSTPDTSDPGTTNPGTTNPTPSPSPSPSPSAAPTPITATVQPASPLSAEATTQLAQSGAQIVGNAIQVNLFENVNNTETGISSSEDYVEIKLTANAPFTTVVFIDENGTMHHVPTLKIDGNTVVASATRSGTYALVNLDKSFADTNGHWAEQAISNLANRGILNGNGNGQFLPNQEITRAEFAAILVRALGLSHTSQQVNYSDIANDAWYSQAIQIASSYGLISGNPDGSFKPEDTITREQAMVILARAAKLNGLTASSASTIDQYEDSSEVSNYAKVAVDTNIKLGLVNGVSDTHLAPKASLTRAEIAVVIERLLKMAGLIN